VRDSRTLDLRHDPEKAMFIPWQQFNDGQPNNYGFLVRVSAGDPMALAPMLPELVRQADPRFRIRAIQSYEDLIGDTIVTERIMAALGGFFGILALMVAERHRRTGAPRGSTHDCDWLRCRRRGCPHPHRTHSQNVVRHQAQRSPGFCAIRRFAGRCRARRCMAASPARFAHRPLDRAASGLTTSRPTDV
jgi:hypothetical protein